MVMHYSQLAYMGFIQVALHARPILEGMRLCKRDIVAWNPDAVILVDYPGFNLKIARFVKSHTSIPVWYYIPPKIWAWKQRRIRNIRRDVDEVFSILPFEVPSLSARAATPAKRCCGSFFPSLSLSYSSFFSRKAMRRVVSSCMTLSLWTAWRAWASS